MNENRLFNLTRLRLALWYAGIMSLVFAVSGYGFYQGLVHAHLQALNRELESVAGTLHDSLKLKLNHPGKVEPIVKELLPDLCFPQDDCSINLMHKTSMYLLNPIYRGNYYVRLVDTSGNLVAYSGVYPEEKPLFSHDHQSEIVLSKGGDRYKEITFLLHTKNNLDWGYLQVGRSLKEFDDYLENVKLVVNFGVPSVLILVGICSWWFAGLAMQPLYQSYRQIQQFSADVAHELRTPLAATQATVESALLIDKWNEEDTKELLESINRQNRRLIKLVQDLLLLIRLERNTKLVNLEIIDIDELVSDLIEEFTPLAAQEKVKLSYKYSKVGAILGDTQQIYRLVSNLIINGIQYTPPLGEVKVIVEDDEHELVILVEDTGIGIAPDDLPQIFQRFYRSESSRSTGGSGLGLSIAKAIATAHKGSINVRSTLGKGSTFIVRLPKNLTKKVKISS